MGKTHQIRGVMDQNKAAKSEVQHIWVDEAVNIEPLPITFDEFLVKMKNDQSQKLVEDFLKEGPGN